MVQRGIKCLTILIFFFKKFKIFTTCPPPLIMYASSFCVRELEAEEKGTLLLLCVPSEITRKVQGENIHNYYF